jgi:hypothetical protein
MTDNLFIFFLEQRRRLSEPPHSPAAKCGACGRMIYAWELELGWAVFEGFGAVCGDCLYRRYYGGSENFDGGK